MKLPPGRWFSGVGQFVNARRLGMNPILEYLFSFVKDDFGEF
jgi:hypothetical protein